MASPDGVYEAPCNPRINMGRRHMDSGVIIDENWLGKLLMGIIENYQ